MRELDLLLARFLDRSFDALPAPEQQAYERLLDENDHDLLRWLTGKHLPADPELARVVIAVRNANGL